MASVDLDELLTNEETADLLGIQPNTLEHWRCAGKGPPFVKLGKHPASPIRYVKSRLMAWIDENTHESTSSYTAATAHHLDEVARHD